MKRKYKLKMDVRPIKTKVERFFNPRLNCLTKALFRFKYSEIALVTVEEQLGDDFANYNEKYS